MSPANPPPNTPTPQARFRRALDKFRRRVDGSTVDAGGGTELDGHRRQGGNNGCGRREVDWTRRGRTAASTEERHVISTQRTGEVAYTYLNEHHHPKNTSSPALPMSCHITQSVSANTGRVLAVFEPWSLPSLCILTSSRVPSS